MGTKSEIEINVIDGLINEMLSYRLTTTRDVNSEIPQNVRLYRNIVGLLGIDGIVTQRENSSNIKQSIQLAVAELFRLERFGFSESEFIRARNKALSRLGSDQTIKPTNNNMLLNVYSYHYNGSAFVADESKQKKDILNSMTLSYVNNEIKSFLGTRNNLSVLLSVPNIKEVPTQAEVFSWIAEVEDKQLEPFKDLQIKSLPYVPKDIKSSYRVQNLGELGATPLVFKNGATAYHKTLTS